MIVLTYKKFDDVFSKIQLKGQAYKAFSGSLVKSVDINRKERRVSIELMVKHMINETLCYDIKNQLQTAMPYLNDINLGLHYDLAESEKPQAILNFRDNLISILDNESPLCAQIMRESDWSLTENRLTLELVKNSSFILTGKKMGQRIEDLINSRFGTSIAVCFKDKPEDKNHKNHEEIIIKREQEIIRSTQTAASPSRPRPAGEKKPFTEYKSSKRSKRVRINHELTGMVTKLSEELPQDDEILFTGEIIEVEERVLRSGNLIVIFDVSDYTDSITVKFFISPEEYTDNFKSVVSKGNTVIILGKVQFDDFSKELNVSAQEIGNFYDSNKEVRMDSSEEKRVELHLHTQMSSMDATNHISDYIKRAAKWGHKAIAVTDHGIVQAFPDAMTAAKKNGIKVIYGVEAYLVDDLDSVVSRDKGQTLDTEFIVFDIETTGLKPKFCNIIEIGAVKVVNGEIIETFNTFADPGESIPYSITELTGITDEMVRGKPSAEEALRLFQDFAGSGVLVAHNAAFDVGFISYHGAKYGINFDNTVLDTLALSRGVYPELKKYKLDIVAKHLGINLENHHRAGDDAAATAEIFIKALEKLRLQIPDLTSLEQINGISAELTNHKKLKHYHAVILVKNQQGLKNLYTLVSMAHIDYFYKRPRILKSKFIKYREGLIIGTACEAGEFYQAVRENASETRIDSLARFYDYFEIQPNGNNMYLIRNGSLNSVNDLIEINKEIVRLGEKYSKPVVATCDVHFLNPEDSVYRKIIMYGEGFKDAENQAPLFYRTTEEMLEEFEYLGKEKAREVVITNTNLIADMTEDVKPIPDETFPPKIDGAEEQIRDITISRAKELYGDPLPEIVESRLNRELESIIKNGFSVMYIIAQKLVWKSVEDGYLVGSRGSVGSSFVATMAGITEVNPLSPHYVCPKCRYSDFESEEVKAFAGASGCDMPDKNCPKCGTKLNKDGHDIPFETFLGFDGDKEPDIDLNFSGEYQAKAHIYTEELFGTGHVFKAGTIGTIADKTAYGYVKKYMDEKNPEARRAEINRLKIGCTGIKRTTGQHPGGLMIVPEGYSIYDFCPVQRPANDQKSDVTTTHFDYHSISGRLLKLDLLGHDVPTIIRMLHDATGIDPRTVDLGDKDVMSLFNSPQALKLTPEDINCKTGTLGLPEFGTPFVRQMLMDTQPSTFAELVRISGLSHGTDVWFNNAQELIKEGTATLKEIIPCRDDIMVYLINKGVEKKPAFKIMENVRKGKGLTDDEVELMEACNVPDWYIESCRRIKYMFPKGHAVAYVMMTVRIGYFKVHHPYAFYAASFSVKAEDFDYELMCFGRENVLKEIQRINLLGKEATAKEKSSLTILELVSEMYARGLKFAMLNIYKASAFKFLITPEGLMAPLCSVQGLGGNAAESVVTAREEGEFFTIEDFRERTKVNKTVTEVLKRVGIFEGMSETNQLSLFG